MSEIGYPRRPKDFAEKVGWLEKQPWQPLEGTHEDSPLFQYLNSIAESSEPSAHLRRNLQFKREPAAAVFEWLLRPRTGWNKFLEVGGFRAEIVLGLLHLLQSQLSKYRYIPNEAESLSLITRRLIYFAANGDELLPGSLERRLCPYHSWRLPVPSAFAPGVAKVPFRNCQRGTALSFLRHSAQFLAGERVFHIQSRDQDAAELAQDRGLSYSFTFRGEKFGLSVDSLKERHRPPKVFEIHAACTSYLAPDPRSLVGVGFLLREMRGSFWDNSKNSMWDRELRFLAALLPAATGIPLREVLDISLNAPRSMAEAFGRFQHDATKQSKVLGYFCSQPELVNLGFDLSPTLDERYWLMRFIGPHSDENFTSRICDQFLLIPMPAELLPFVASCRGKSGPQSTFSALIQTADPLAGITSMVDRLVKRMIHVEELKPKGWYAKTLRAFVHRGDRAFIYTAALSAKLPPALLSLMLGRPYGIWRSGSNYASIPMERIMNAFTKVHSFSWNGDPAAIAGVNFPDVGAGLLEKGRISRAGLPSLAEVAHLHEEFQPKDIIRSAAKLNFAERLLGRRYSAHLPNPSDSLLPLLNSYCWLDKNLSGRSFPRFMPLPLNIASSIRDSDWDKLPSTIIVPPEKRDSVKKIRIYKSDPSAGRKALYSHLIQEGIGDEAVSALFGHGMSLTKLFGPISPIPTAWFLEELRQDISKVSQQSKLEGFYANSLQLSDRQIKRIREKKIKTPLSQPLSEYVRLDARVQNLPVPTQDHFERLQRILTALQGRFDQSSDPFSQRFLLNALFLLLAIFAIPFNRLWTFRNYIFGNSLIHLKDDDAFFLIAPTIQKDIGLGLVPLRICRDSGKLLLRIFQELKVSSLAQTTHGFDYHRLFSSFTARKNVVAFAASLIGESNNPRKVLDALMQGTKFLARMRGGALLFSSISGRAFVPPNYFSIEDIFFAVFERPCVLKAPSGHFWKNPLTYSQNELTRIASYQRSVSPRKIGRPAKPPTWPSNNSEDLIVEYFHESLKHPTFKNILLRLSKINQFLPHYSANPDPFRRQWLSARRIQRRLLEGGFLRTGAAEHLLTSRMTLSFLDHLNQLLDGRPKIAAYREIIKWWVIFILLTGCRPSEALRMQREHLDYRDFPRILRIQGTKTFAAARTLDLNFLGRDKAAGAILRERLHKFRKNSHFALPATFSIAGLKKPRLFRIANAAIDIAFAQLRSEQNLPPAEGRFTLYSLRHAAAFRVTQNVINEHLWGGNFWTAMASASVAFGHQSMVTTLSSYLGTAMLALKWKGRHSKGFCPLREEPVEYLRFSISK